VDEDRIVVGAPLVNGNIGAAYLSLKRSYLFRSEDSYVQYTLLVVCSVCISVDLEADTIVVGAEGRGNDKSAI
jgi:hypothetical protein